MEGNYNKILEKVSHISGLAVDEIDRRVEAKRAKLSGLISRDGALQVIAAELNISFDNEKLKIDELLPGMRKVNFTGKVITLYPVREFTTKSGDVGKVVNMIVADDTSNIKVVLWDTNHIGLVETGSIKVGTSIEVISGSMRDNEVHLGSFSDLKVSFEEFNDVQTQKPVKVKTIKEFSVGEKISSRAFIVQSFDPRFFEVNTKTGKKASEEEIASGVPTEKRIILNVAIDDGTETIRAVLFHDNVLKIGIASSNNIEKLIEEKQNVLGKEFIFVGNVRMNSYFNSPELIVESVEGVNLDLLIKELE